MKACGKAYHDNSGIVLDCADVSPCRECLLVEVGRLGQLLKEANGRMDLKSVQMLVSSATQVVGTLLPGYPEGSYGALALVELAEVVSRIHHLPPVMQSLVGKMEFALRGQSPVDPEMPKGRDELQKLLNKAWRSGNQAAHEAYRVSWKVGTTQNGVPHDA